MDCSLVMFERSDVAVLDFPRSSCRSTGSDASPSRNIQKYLDGKFSLTREFGLGYNGQRGLYFIFTAL